MMNAPATARVKAEPAATDAVDVGALFDAHAAALLRLVERLTGPGGHVEDVVQDVFLVAHRGADALAAAESPRAWLYGIAVNLCREERRRRRRREGLWRLWGPREAAPTVAADDVAARRQLGERVRACVAALPDAQREVVVLYELEGLEGAAIAALLEIPVNTVWTRLHAARGRLAGILRKRGLGPGGER
ncbi:MAG: RNA polymerase subunit sigma-24 [Deltaproteobacteria bacterium HGW-Deltaproteobacteria-14]|jgi:RNA polymerase sigma-70 factor (ECF subfamily)|nr:MAG: RNA polymerase subunit sigma-24 [Deltaproteobacteria bacterium HGW-Deltaproteobacteria-14]